MCLCAQRPWLTDPLEPELRAQCNPGYGCWCTRAASTLNHESSHYIPYLGDLFSAFILSKCLTTQTWMAWNSINQASLWTQVNCLSFCLLSSGIKRCMPQYLGLSTGAQVPWFECQAHGAQRTTSRSLLPLWVLGKELGSLGLHGMCHLTRLSISNKPSERALGTFNLKLVGYKTTQRSSSWRVSVNTFFFFFTVVSLLLRVGMVNTYNPSTWKDIEDDHRFETARISKKNKNKQKTQKELSQSLAVWEKGHTECTPRNQDSIWQTFIEHLCARSLCGAPEISSQCNLVPAPEFPA